MKSSVCKIHLAAAALFFSTIFTAAAQTAAVTGRVVDDSDNPVAYATVVLLKEGLQASGGSTDDQGAFRLKASAGDYIIKVQFIGYKSVESPLAVTGDTDAGTFVLEPDQTRIDDVVVTAQLIRREADRFVVDVANSSAAIGKNAEELLKTAPGVWISDDTISINGNSGSKIYINDREVHMDDTQLMAYLRTLTADDIQKIEVIPQTGADYDASSSGGVIKLTLRRRTQSGLMGSISTYGRVSSKLTSISPSFSLDYNHNSLNLYASGWYSYNDSTDEVEEHTTYTSQAVSIDGQSSDSGKFNSAGGRIGTVYEFNTRHSIGAEVNYWYNRNPSSTTSLTQHTSPEIVTDNTSFYDNTGDGQQITATFNYIWHVDDNGSVMKLLADYTDNTSTADNRYFNSAATPLGVKDSTYTSAIDSHYRLGTATLSFDKVFSPKFTLKTGLKYTLNNTSNTADYNGLAATGEWIRDDGSSFDMGYTEHIGAAYAIASANLGRVSLVAGLRGEYTHSLSKDRLVKQDYFDLFPNANISYSLTADGAYSLIAQYSRTIARPSFWSLTPTMLKISEYMYQTGNPNLKASYNNSVSLTAVLKYKYTISAGASFIKNSVQQTTVVDANNPDLLALIPLNIPTIDNYYVDVYLPFQLTKWWEVNLNARGAFMGQKITESSPTERYFMGMYSGQMSFTLPKNFIIELWGYCMHGLVSGNVHLGTMGDMNLSVKKRLCDNKLTLTAGMGNILNNNNNASIQETEFRRDMVVRNAWSRRQFTFSVTYNFNAGKQFKSRAVESGSAEDQARLSGGSGMGN